LFFDERINKIESDYENINIDNKHLLELNRTLKNANAEKEIEINKLKDENSVINLKYNNIEQNILTLKNKNYDFINEHQKLNDQLELMISDKNKINLD